MCPGIRIERDDYLKTIILPRALLHVITLDDTGFTLGLNHGRSFASLKLANRILKINDDSTRQHQELSSL